jgi:methionine synthase I (cobalamin-dependent)
MDGAMGTELQRRSACADFDGIRDFNLTRPELVAAVHRDYVAAGADVILTNTFRVPHDAQELCGAIQLAREVRPWFVLAGFGPAANLSDALASRLLPACTGADGVLVETLSSPTSLDRLSGPSLRVPVLASFAFRHHQGALLTFEDVQPEACAIGALRCGAVAVGANCGNEITTKDMVEIARRFRSVCDLPMFVRPNAGTPVKTGNAWVYPRTAVGMASDLPALVDAGVAMIGGCCGTTPEHIRAFRLAMEQMNAPRGR